jgi:hypothetical protein
MSGSKTLLLLAAAGVGVYLLTRQPDVEQASEYTDANGYKWRIKRFDDLASPGTAWTGYALTDVYGPKAQSGVFGATTNAVRAEIDLIATAFGLSKELTPA